MTKRATSIRLTVEARRMLVALARKLGVSQSAVIEMAIRRLDSWERSNKHKGDAE